MRKPKSSFRTVSHFTAITGKDGEQRIKDGNLKMYDDVIFCALFSYRPDGLGSFDES